MSRELRVNKGARLSNTEFIPSAGGVQGLYIYMGVWRCDMVLRWGKDVAGTRKWPEEILGARHVQKQGWPQEFE